MIEQCTCNQSFIMLITVPSRTFPHLKSSCAYIKISRNVQLGFRIAVQQFNTKLPTAGPHLKGPLRARTPGETQIGHRPSKSPLRHVYVQY